MKRNILVILIIGLSWCYCEAQWLPMNPITSLYYNNSNTSNYQILIQDSLIYTFRDDGLEYLNTYTNSTNYHWANYYQLKCIVADTGKTYVYLSNNNYIGRFNKNTNKYENIWPDSLSSIFVGTIGVSPDGKVWATTWNGTQYVAIYNGVNWKLNQAPYNYLNGLKVVNDTMAYVKTSNTFFKFHNGVFDSISTIPYPVAYYLEDWDADNNNNLWIAARYNLININKGNITTYDSSNVPAGFVNFYHVKIGSNGNVWTASNSHTMLEYVSGNFLTSTLPLSGNNNIENFSLNNLNEPYVIIGNNADLLYIYNGSSWSSISFPFMPLRKIKAMGLLSTSNNYNLYGNFATDEGVFSVSLSGNYYIYNFSDTASIPHANDVTCFTEDDESYSYYTSSFGTHSGVYNLSGFDNTMLPNDTINHICYYSGSYYIGTDNGLLVYNGLLYNTLNTSNSPLPSNKITFVSTGNDNYCSNSTALYIGTDKGLAIYQNAQWTIYDSINIPVSNFYVTGATPVCFDSAVYISTKGSGLIAVYPHGSYNIYNISNGKLLDDTLYYVMEVQLADCGDYFLTGTSHHGVAFSSDYYYQQSFNYDTLYNGIFNIHNSKTIAYSQSFYMVGTDSLIYLLSPCGTISEKNQPKELKWFQQGNELIITVPGNLYGDGNILLTDLPGKIILKKEYDTKPGNIKIDISNLASGIYILRLNVNNQIGYTKIALSH